MIYKLHLVNKQTRVLYKTKVTAESEEEACKIAVKEAQSQNIFLPDDLWVRFIDKVKEEQQ